MVDLCRVVKWWSENRTEKACLWSKMSGYLNVLPSHVTLPFEYRTPKLSGVRYSDCHCIGTKVNSRVESGTLDRIRTTE